MALLQVQRADAKRTLENLIRVHEQTIRDIDGGKKFWKDGVDISADIRKRCNFEITQCRVVHEALDEMHSGHIKRAAGLCEQIQEYIAGFSAH